MSINAVMSRRNALIGTMILLVALGLMFSSPFPVEGGRTQRPRKPDRPGNTQPGHPELGWSEWRYCAHRLQNIPA